MPERDPFMESAAHRDLVIFFYDRFEGLSEIKSEAITSSKIQLAHDPLLQEIPPEKRAIVTRLAISRAMTAHEDRWLFQQKLLLSDTLDWSA